MRSPLLTHWIIFFTLLFALTTTACTEPDPDLTNDNDADASQNTNPSNTSPKIDATSCTTSTDCSAREFCNDDKTCAKATSCQHIECASNERCLAINLTCVHDCISDATLCTDGLVCNPETAKCQNPGCINPSATPGSCAGATPHYDPETCSCVGCIDNSNCHNQEICGPTNTCVRADCETICAPTEPETCSGQTPYCANNCCSECIGNSDCPAPNTCVRGTCTSST